MFRTQDLLEQPPEIASPHLLWKLTHRSGKHGSPQILFVVSWLIHKAPGGICCAILNVDLNLLEELLKKKKKNSGKFFLVYKYYICVKYVRNSEPEELQRDFYK